MMSGDIWTALQNKQIAFDVFSTASRFSGTRRPKRTPKPLAVGTQVTVKSRDTDRYHAGHKSCRPGLLAEGAATAKDQF